MSIHPNPATLMAFKDGALPPEDLTSIVDHTSGCPRCQSLLEEERALDAILFRGKETICIPDALPAMIAQRVLESAHQPLMQRSIIYPIATACVAMALALILSVAPVLSMGLEPSIVAVGVSLKEGVMLLRELLPLLKAIVTLVQHAWLPLMIGLTMAALLPIIVASRAFGPGTRLRSA